jgi:competence protein ComEA
MLRGFKDFLTFNKAERNGIFILLILILLGLIFNIITPLLFRDEIKNDPALIAKISETLDKNKEKISLTKTKVAQTDTTVYFTFDPNTLQTDQWRKLGLTDKQISVIENYRKMGGKFYKNEDLKKIYSISNKTYQRLLPYIKIKPITSKKANKKQKAKKEYPKAKPMAKIELNAADSAMLVKLRGIGPVFATRIIKYRKMLGGFRNKNQLLEVYGLNKKRLKGFENDILIDTNQIRKLKINSADFKDLLRHPYFSYSLTKEIYHFRDSAKFTSKAQIQNLKTLPDSLFQKIAPYLSLE